MVGSTLQCSDTVLRSDLDAEVLGLIQSFTDFVFHHMYSEGETEITVQVNRQKETECPVCMYRRHTAAK